MALSEHEQKVLDELGRSLYADDEQLARRLKKVAEQTPDRQKQRSAGRKVAGAALVLGGLGVLLVGVIVHYAWMGVGGFVMTLAGLLVATSKVAGPAVDAPADAKRSPKSRSTRKLSLNEFFEERWDRRMNDQ
jgi:hypothetical protein